MTSLAVVLALLAAALHAGWNLAAARREDIQATAAVALAVGMVMLTPFAIVFWDLEAEALPYVGASIAFELAYYLLLVAAYRRAPVDVVYPVARGAAPVLILLVSALALGAELFTAEVVGVIAVSAGIVLVRGSGHHADPRGVLLGLAVAAAICAYTLSDDRGIRHAGPLTYMAVVHIPVAFFLLAQVGRERARAALDRATVGIGAALVGAYILVLVALELAPAAPVAALRETGVVMVALFAAYARREHLALPRIAGAAVVTAGVVLVAA